MNKIIIYAKGEIFENYKDIIIWDNVMAISDKRIETTQTIDGVLHIPPDDINNYDAEFIAIFSNKYFDEIERELIGDYFINPDKIVSWQILIPRELNHAMSNMFQRVIITKKAERVLDTDGTLIPQMFYSAKNLFQIEQCEIDVIGKLKYKSYSSIYSNKFTDLLECEKNYDVVLIWKWDIELMEMAKLHARYLVISLPYVSLCDINICEMRNKLQKLGHVRKLNDAYGLTWLVDTKKHEICKLDAKIYVVMHKKYNVEKNDLYNPICVGDNYFDANYLNEKSQENISFLNSKINECTALYWIWKNTTSEIVGLCHYRRYFCSDNICKKDNYIDKAKIKEILSDYDIILPQWEPVYGNDIMDGIKYNISKKAFEKGMSAFRTAIIQKQPNYVMAFDDVMKGHRAFYLNMFITKREIMNAYCEWLFSFLLDVAKEMDIRKYDPYSKRVIGFFAERMWTVWLMEQSYKIYDLPGTW